MIEIVGRVVGYLLFACLIWIGFHIIDAREPACQDPDTQISIPDIPHPVYPLLPLAVPV